MTTLGPHDCLHRSISPFLQASAFRFCQKLLLSCWFPFKHNWQRFKIFNSAIYSWFPLKSRLTKININLSPHLRRVRRRRCGPRAGHALGRPWWPCAPRDPPWSPHFRHRPGPINSEPWYGLYMVIIWFVYGYYMVCIWLLYGLYMVCIWLMMGIYGAFQLVMGVPQARWMVFGNGKIPSRNGWWLGLALFQETSTSCGLRSMEYHWHYHNLPVTQFLTKLEHNRTQLIPWPFQVGISGWLTKIRLELTPSSSQDLWICRRDLESQAAEPRASSAKCRWIFGRHDET